jgi:hypothetical protein
MPGSQKNKHHLAVIKEPSQDTRTILISDTGGALFAGSEAAPEIGLKLNVTGHSVRNYVYRILDELQLSTRVELILML